MDDSPFTLDIDPSHKEALLSALPQINAAKQYVQTLKAVGIDVSEYEARVNHLHGLTTRLVDTFVYNKRPRRQL